MTASDARNTDTPQTAQPAPTAHTESLSWQWQGQTIEVGLTRQGAGPTVILLPALSTVSTRHELSALQARLSERFTTVSVDWPGFGDRPRPFVDWDAQALVAFLRHLLDEVIFMPDAVIAAGHGAGLMLRHLKDAPGVVDRLVLIAPTWRGPLPTMAGEQKPWFGHLRYWFDRPGIGAALYRLNITDWFIKRMANEHVYQSSDWLAGERLADKKRVARAEGARHGSIRFVTGGLDAFRTREAAVEALRRAQALTLLITTPHMPVRSGAAMEALARLPRVETARLPRGRLLVHEEFPDDVAEAILQWWDRDSGV